MLEGKSPEKRFIQNLIGEGNDTWSAYDSNGLSKDLLEMMKNLEKHEYIEIIMCDKYRISLKLTEEGKKFALK